MARGSVFKRCQCRDQQGRKITGCRLTHGSWTFHIDTGHRPNGSRDQIKRGGYRTRSEAEQAMTEALAKLDAGTWTNDRSVTVGQWLNQWLADGTAAGWEAKTRANYSGHVRDVWLPQLGDLRLRDLRRRHIDKVIRGLAKPQTDPRPPGLIGRHVTVRKPSTLDGYRRTIRAALSAAVRADLIVLNPAEGRIDAIPTSRRRPETFWTPEQTARFLEETAADPLAALFEVAAYAGLRRAELCGARWGDLDPDGAGLTIRSTVVEVASKILTPAERVCPVCSAEHKSRVIKVTKSEAGDRWVPLAGPAQAALTVHRVGQDDDRRLYGRDYSDHDLIFALPDGTPMRPSNVTRKHQAHATRLGLPPIRLHDMRHGACALLLAGGVPIEIVALILGHSTPDVTRRIYAHVLRGETSAQVEAATDALTRHRRPSGG
jgi:integrase